MNEENNVEQPIEEKTEVVSEMPQPPAEHSGSRADFMLPTSIVIAAVLISGTIWYAIGGRNTVPATQQANVGATAGATQQDVMTLGSDDVILGNQNAPVTVIEYGDYQCPFCARFFEDAERQIIANYVKTGKAKMVFRNLAFLGPESTAAAVAAECSKDQNQFWAYHDALYTAKIQDTVKGGGEGDGFFASKVFVSIAMDLKMDIGKFTQCISSKKYDTAIANSTAASENAGISSTPTTFINGAQIKGAQPYATFASAIDAALANKK